MTTQDEEGGPSKKTHATCKKKNLRRKKKTASQFQEELKLEPIHIEANPELGVVNQSVVEQDQSNEPPEQSDEDVSDQSE